jgi:hypothetical protein
MSSPTPAVREDPLVGRLMTVQNNYALGLAALALLTADSSQAQLRTDSANFGPFTVHLAQVADLMQVPPHRDDAIKSFHIMLMCSLIKDTFELVKHHAETAGLANEMKSQHWYHLARLVRNGLGHNFLLEFNARDLALMPVTWRNVTLTASMNHQQLPLAIFGYPDAWQLFLDMQAFAVEHAL